MPAGSTPRGARVAQQPLPADSLAFALMGAARVCAGVREGRTLRDGLALERARPGASATNDPQAAIHDLAARTLRRRGRADTLLESIAGRIPQPPLLRELLVVAIALLVDALDAPAASFDERVATLPYAPFTLVDQAVRAAASDPVMARGKNFANAVLRTLLRRIDEDCAALRDALYGTRAPDIARHELPTWWVRRLVAAWPDDWRGIVDVSLAIPPLVVRVNRRRTMRDAYLAMLAVAGIAADAIGTDGVRFRRALPVARVPGFADGLASVQDEAAQRAAPLLGIEDGMRVLDACAAPGGKTGHLLELADVDCTALDTDPLRLSRVAENLERLGLAARLVAGDATRPAGWWDGRSFDRILADVPCTASGILRRHPDIRWLRRETDIAALSRSAQQITGALWPLLEPGGRLLLVTCSVFPEESNEHAVRFAARFPDAVRLPAPGQLLPANCGRGRDGIEAGDHDGLFFALFEKMR